MTSLHFLNFQVKLALHFEVMLRNVDLSHMYFNFFYNSMNSNCNKLCTKKKFFTDLVSFQSEPNFVCSLLWDTHNLQLKIKA